MGIYVRTVLKGGKNRTIHVYISTGTYNNFLNPAIISKDNL
jgi:hypothetical protein